ncbi:uncharacterized protein LOC120075850 [Benincasa hispida]|uniref:uncharacterized protein LOC120075850 n=1 Tax=Benincasa hispida TaxID=102211 RepID=UPI001901EC87|nr:uncharacterized protein LOC120075850 [Benincasa hispida]
MVPVPSVPKSVKRPEDSITNNDHSITNHGSTSSEATTSTNNESQQDSESKSSQPLAPKTQQARDLNKQSNDQELHINIPLVEALEQMPSYVKFLKDILANKRKIGKNETVALTYECSALFQNNIPKKRSKEFHIAMSIGEGKIEDVLVQVDKFIFPADFVILDYEADTEVSIILGCPFLATGRVLIDVQKGELTIRVDNQQAKFNVLNALNYPGDMKNCQYVRELQEEHWHEFREELEEKDFEVGAMLEENCTAIQTEPDFETIRLSKRATQQTKPSLEEPPMLELKALLVHLKYVYLGGNNTLPVIISASLSKEKEEALIQILKKYAKALGWTLVDI